MICVVSLLWRDVKNYDIPNGALEAIAQTLLNEFLPRDHSSHANPMERPLFPQLTMPGDELSHDRDHEVLGLWIALGLLALANLLVSAWLFFH